VLAGGHAGPRPVIAIAVISGELPSPHQIQAVITDAHDHRADMLLLEAKNWQQAAATSEALSGYIPPPVRPAPKPVCTSNGSGNGRKTQTGSTRQVGTAAIPGVSASPSPAKNSAPRCRTPKPPPSPPGRTVPMNLESMDVAVVTAAHPEGIAARLPAAAQVIDTNGNVIRAGVTPTGPGLLVLLWGCLLIIFAGLATRGIALLRPPSAPPARAPTPDPPVRTPPAQQPVQPVDGPVAPPEQPVKAPPRSLAGDILAKYQPSNPVTRWQPQCPRCGSFRVESAGGDGACQSCGHRWPWADQESWPDVVVSHRRRRGDRLNPANRT
jgi:hypothetical protein